MIAHSEGQPSNDARDQPDREVEVNPPSSFNVEVKHESLQCVLVRTCVVRVDQALDGPHAVLIGQISGST